MICLAMSFYASWFPVLNFDLDVSETARLLLAVADHGEDLVLAQDDVVDVVDLDLAARVLAHEDAVARLDVHRRTLAVIGQLARADGDDLGLLRLFLGGVRDDDASPDLLLCLAPLDQNPIVQWTDVHGSTSFIYVETKQVCLGLSPPGRC